MTTSPIVDPNLYTYNTTNGATTTNTTTNTASTDPSKANETQNSLFDVSVMETPEAEGDTYEAKAAAEAKAACTDGKDDGEIGFGETLGSFFKGVAKPITSMFESPKNFFTGLAGIAVSAGVCALTGGAAIPLFIAAGAGMGVIQGGKGLINATNATTDAEAKAALEDVGTGAFAIASSAIGARGYMKSKGITSFKDLKATVSKDFAGSKVGSFFKKPVKTDAQISAQNNLNKAQNEVTTLNESKATAQQNFDNAKNQVTAAKQEAKTASKALTNARNANNGTKAAKQAVSDANDTLIDANKALHDANKTLSNANKALKQSNSTKNTQALDTANKELETAKTTKIDADTVAEAARKAEAKEAMTAVKKQALTITATGATGATLLEDDN